jgi:hypothetical protein
VYCGGGGVTHSIHSSPSHTAISLTLPSPSPSLTLIRTWKKTKRHFHRSLSVPSRPIPYIPFFPPFPLFSLSL